MMYALIPVCLCLMVLFLMKESKKEYVPAVSLKGLASACFVILGFMLSNGAKTAQLITTGLLLGAIADVRHFGRTALEQFTLRLGAGNVTRDDGAAGDRFAKNHSQFGADLAGRTDHQNIFHLD